MRELNQYAIPATWMGDKKNRRNYDPAENKVLLVTRQSSKGLEFPRVIVAGLGSLKDDDDTKPEEARLLYVAMTRAQEYLLLTASNNNHYTQRFAETN
jgi:superfamily I DNA/RNA helicase